MKVTINSVIQPLHLEHLKQRYKSVPVIELEQLARNTKWSDKTANNLTKCIIRFFEYSGIYATRIQSQGQAVVKREQYLNVLTNKVETTKEISFRKGTTKKGTADIHAVYKGLHLSIEVKIGKDKMSDAQIETERLINQNGGFYFIAKDFLSFYEWFTNKVKKEARTA